MYPIYGTPGILPEQQNTGPSGLLGNPLLQIGLGILGNSRGYYGALGPALANGISQGMHNAQTSQYSNQRMQYANMQMEELKRKQASEMALNNAISEGYKPQGSPSNTQEPIASVSMDQDAVLNNILSNPAIDSAVKLNAMQTMRKDRSPLKVSRGETLVDPTTMRPIYSAQEEPKYQFAPNGRIVDMNNPDLTQTYRSAPEGMEWENGQLKSLPGFISMKSQIAAAGRPVVNVNTKQEAEESKAVGKYFGEQYADIQKAGLSAGGKINRVQRLNQLLSGVDTGKLTPIGVELASTAQSLGFNIDKKLGNKQAAEALANEMALELRNPSGGAGMPGAMSDADREFLKRMTPGLEKTPEGRKLISQSMVSLAKRDQDVAKIARKYRKAKGTLDEGFYEELQSYADANPVFQGAVDPIKFKSSMNAKDLVKGQQYLFPNGKTMVWNGMAFD
jgi:hypothetical protein